MVQKLQGEKIIQSVLDKLGLSYSTKVKLSRLVLDPKKYRQPDFYLPDYRLYIEYFSTWDAKVLKEKERAKYLEKQKIYMANNMDCLYLYPKDLTRVERLIKQKIESIMERKLPKDNFVPVPLLPQPTSKPKTEIKKAPKKKKPKNKVVIASTKNLDDVVTQATTITETTITKKPVEEEPKAFNAQKEFDEKPKLSFEGLIEMMGGVLGILIILELVAIVILAIVYFFF